jgi:hypothetical protein
MDEDLANVRVDKESMSKVLVNDELWEVVGPLLPEEPLNPRGGRAY